MFKSVRTILCGFLILSLGTLFVYGDACSAMKLRTQIGGDPVNMDPAALAFSQDRFIAGQIYQGLVDFDLMAEPPYPIVPVLAKSYQVSNDSRMITFNLENGVTFHHGYGELTSEDVVYSLQRHLDPKLASRARGQLGDIERIEATDKYTVTLHLKTSSAISLLGNLAWQNAGYILSKKACEALGDKIARTPVGTGPFYFEQWIPGEKVVLKKFEKYWKTPAKIDEIEFWVIAEDIIALGALEKGDLGLVSVSQLGAYKRAKTMKNIYLAEAKASVWQYIYYLNHKMKPMDDVRVRRALAHALDIKSICSRIGRLVEAFPSSLSSAVIGATDEFWTYDYDVEKAKQLLTEAGYPKGFDLSLIYNKHVLYEPIVLEVQRYWNQIVNVKLELVERAVWKKKLSKYEHHVAAWGLGRLVPYLYAERYETGNSRNYNQYSNPKADAAIKKAVTASTEEEAKKHWREFQRITAEDVASIVVAVGGNLQAVSNKVKGVVLHPYTGLIYLEKATIH
jgi:peptide/nickel transport system substrate-binding protein